MGSFLLVNMLSSLVLGLMFSGLALLGESEDELKDDSDEYIIEAGEEMEEEFLQFANEETQHPRSAKTLTEEPITTEHHSKPLPEGKPTDAKDPWGNKQPTGMGSPSTHPHDGVKPRINKGKTSSEVESNYEPLKLTTFGEIKALLGESEDELKDDSDEYIIEAGEEMEEEFLQFANEETQHPHSAKTLTEEPITTEHQSPSPNKDDPESFKANKSADSHNASGHESSSCSKTFKNFNNYMPVTERVLER
nr:hypothetical protein [Tanacetum cinerariifolium]